MGFYIVPIRQDFLSLSGGTVSGDTVFSQGLTASTLFSGVTNLTDIIINLVNETVYTANHFLPLSGGTGGAYNFTGTTSAQTIDVSQNIFPTQDNVSDLGSGYKRFRSLNTVNGVATNFTATTRITTNSIMLGSRELREENIIITGDTVQGGSW